MNSRSRIVEVWPYLLGAAFGLLIFVLIWLFANPERQGFDTIVRYTSGETRCFEGMKHTTEEGFVRLYDREKDITIPESRVVNVHTSKSACK